MRIGILTFHYGSNYGGILQCYSLQKILQLQGHDVQVLNIQPTQSKIWLRRVINKLKQLSSLKELLENIYKHISIQDDNKILEKKMTILKVFDTFRNKYINLSPLLNEQTIGSYVNDNCDAIIVGSDQVWTSLYDLIPIYFIGWSPEFKGKRLSMLPVLPILL